MYVTSANYRKTEKLINDTRQNAEEKFNDLKGKYDEATLRIITLTDLKNS